MNKKLFKTLLTSAVVLGAVAAPTAAFAQDFDSLIGANEASIANLSAQQAELYAQLAVSYNKLTEVQAEAAQIQANIEDNDQSIKKLEAEIKDLEAAIAKRETLLVDQARALQTNGGGTTNYANVVATSKSVSDFVGRVDVVKKMVNANKSLLAQQKEDKKAVEAKKAEVETVKADNVSKQVSLEALKETLVAEQANNEAVYNQLTSDLTLAQSNRDALVAEKAAYEAAQVQAQLAAQQQAAAQAAEQQAAAQAAQVAQQESQPQASLETVEQRNEQPAAQALDNEVPASSETAKVDLEPADEVQPAAEEQPQATAEQASDVTTAPAETETPAATPAVQEETEAPVAQAVEEEAPAPQVEEAPAEEPAVEENTASYGSQYGNVLATAAKYVGTPYVWGGKSPSGFDCSGFVQYVFKEAYGIDVGSWTVPQESAGTRISVSEAQAGDLYFWGSPGSTWHVAIATGDGGFIHASQPGTPLGYGNIQYFTPEFAVRVR